VGSGFTSFGPKVLINEVGAVAVGSVYGIHSDAAFKVRAVRSQLRSMNFERRVVAHAKQLKKIEVRQLNGILNSFTRLSPPSV
jgi:hypothetical protein